MSRLRIAWSYVRTRGARAAFRGFVRRFVFTRGRWIVTEGTLPGPGPEPDPHGVVFRRATAEDMANLESLRPHRHPEELRARARHAGCVLYVACDGQRIVGYRLAGPPLRHSGPARHFDLGERDISIHENFCHPDYRSRGLARRLRLASDSLLAQDGWRRRVSAIAIDNVPSLRSSLGSGSRPVLYVTYVRVLFYRRYRTSTEWPPEVRAILQEVASRRRGDAPPGASPDAAVR